MKLRNLFAVATLAVLAASSIAVGSQEAARKRLAVPPVENQTQREIGGDMTGPIIQGLTRKKNRSYDVIERSQLDKVLGEMGLGMTGVIDQSSAAQVGKMLGANYVVLGTIVSTSYRDEQYTKPYDVRAPEEPQKPHWYWKDYGGGDERKRKQDAEAKAKAEAEYVAEMRIYEREEMPNYVRDMSKYNEEKRKAESIQYWRTNYSVSVSLKVVDVETGAIVTTAAGSGSGNQDWGTGRPQRISDSLYSSPSSSAFAAAGAQILDYFDPLLPVVLAVHDERKEKTVTINKGKDDGIYVGMPFIAQREGETIKDMNGKVVAVKKENIGDLVVTHVEDATAICKVTGEIKLKRGGKLGIVRGDVLTPGKLERGFFGGIKER